jgi:hypothetical protein
MSTSLRYRRMIKLGALISTAGITMLILFGLTLLLFPVTKICEENCNYISSAPEYLRQLINPLFLFISLILISSGVFFIRIGNRQLYRSL